MINRNFASSIIRSKAMLNATATAAKKSDMTTRFMKNKYVGKVCDMAANNEVLCQSLFSLGLCCVARPATNFLVTPDKKDAGYASSHSIASGVMGFIWPLLTATPLVAGVGVVLKKPHKYLRPELVKKFYPNVGLKEIVENGKKTLKVMTDAKGNLLRQDGSKLYRNFEPLKIKHGEAKAELKEILEKIQKTKPSKTAKLERLNAEKDVLEVKVQKFGEYKKQFEAINPHLYVDENGIVRSKDVLKTEYGKFALDKNGNKIGCAVQKPENPKELDAVLRAKKRADVTPITEEMEIGAKKEQNLKSIINWLPDILLAPPRAALTIVAIPWLLKNVFGMEKNKKTNKQQDPTNNKQEVNSVNQAQTQSTKFLKSRPAFSMIKAHSASTVKKGGL